MTSQNACKLIEKLPEVSVKNHFGSDGFSANKRMFITVWHETQEANIRLPSSLQKEFLQIDGDAFSEINNAWGKQGWTKVHLQYIDAKIFEKTALAAWEFSKEKVPASSVTKKEKSKTSKTKKKK